jgi:hypothetical protein
MEEKQAPQKGQASPAGSQVAAPSISLPKGGGAIRGVGEKFAANPVTGTGSMTVPIATSPGRFRVRPAARALLRLGRRQRTLRFWLVPGAPGHHPQDGQGITPVPGHRGL